MKIIGLGARTAYYATVEKVEGGTLEIALTPGGFLALKQVAGLVAENEGLLQTRQHVRVPSAPKLTPQEAEDAQDWMKALEDNAGLGDEPKPLEEMPDDLREKMSAVGFGEADPGEAVDDEDEVASL